MKTEVEFKVLAGAESKAFLVDLTKLVDRMEKVVYGLKPNRTASPDEAPVEPEEEEDFGTAVKKAVKKVAASFDDDDVPAEPEAPVEPEDDDAGDFTAPPVKKTKPKALTINDLNAACKARAAATGGKKGRTEVLALLKKHFKTESVSEIKPEQYAACIKVMEV